MAVTVDLLLDAAAFTEGGQISGKVLRSGGDAALEVTAFVTIEGLPPGTVVLDPPLLPVRIGPGTSETSFTFATNRLPAVQAATGTARVASALNAMIGAAASVRFTYADDVPAVSPEVRFADLPDGAPSIREDPTRATFLRVMIQRTVPDPAADNGLVVAWEKLGYEVGDRSRWGRTGVTRFGVGETSKAFDVEALDVGADRLITARLVAGDSYAVAEPSSFQVRIEDVSHGGPEPSGEAWWKSGWTRDGGGILVSAGNGRFTNFGNNFYSKENTDRFLSFYRGIDAVNGSVCRDWRPQDWNLYKGGSAGDVGTIHPDSWLNFDKSGHTAYWWDRDFARDWPCAWLVANMVAIPNMKVTSGSSPLVTAAEQEKIVEDVIKGDLDADLVMVGRRMRHQVETLAGGSRRGCASRVLLRPNWEFQGSTSLQVGKRGVGFLDWYVENRGLTQVQARDKYRAFMSRWCRKVREGYAMDVPGEPVRLRIAISLCMYARRGYPLETYVLDRDDYDCIDMMYHPSRDNAQSYRQLWALFHEPTPDGGWGSGRYSHNDALRAARILDLPFASLECGPRWETNGDGDLYTPVRTFCCPPPWEAKAYEAKHYVFTADGIYQLVRPAPGAASVRPSHGSGEQTGGDGYRWRFCLDLGRQLSPYEFAELIFHDCHRDCGRSVCIGSYHVSSSTPDFAGGGDWSTADRDRADPTSKAADWNRFVLMRQRLFGRAA
ncbi:MAG: hypothetical protein U1E45_12965 [Geminicoccaceae bacterium]